MSGAALAALSRASGLRLEAYRSEHVDQIVQRAQKREQVGDETALAVLLRKDEAARTRFRRSIAVSVSGPFRDPAQFELLERELLPPLLAGATRLTVWSAGCADGSELVSVALVLDRLGGLERTYLLGSDVLEENVSVARALKYDEALPDKIRMRLHWELRDVVHEGPPEGKWRLIVCRNLAIYLSPEAKASLHESLAGALASDGVLLLGRSERLSAPKELDLEQVAPHAYRKVSE